MIGARFQAILPVKPMFPRISAATAVALMTAFANDSVTSLKKYPSKPSKTRYQRTYELRKGWRKRPSFGGGDFNVAIFNDGAVDRYGRFYGGFVQGFRHSGDQRQLKRYQRAGWFSLTDVHRQIWPRYRLRVAKALGVSPRRLVRSLEI